MDGATSVSQYERCMDQLDPDTHHLHRVFLLRHKQNCLERRANPHKEHAIKWQNVLDRGMDAQIRNEERVAKLVDERAKAADARRKELREIAKEEREAQRRQLQRRIMVAQENKLERSVAAERSKVALVQRRMSRSASTPASPLMRKDTRPASAIAQSAKQHPPQLSPQSMASMPSAVMGDGSPVSHVHVEDPGPHYARSKAEEGRRRESTLKELVDEIKLVHAVSGGEPAAPHLRAPGDALQSHRSFVSTGAAFQQDLSGGTFGRRNSSLGQGDGSVGGGSMTRPRSNSNATDAPPPPPPSGLTRQHSRVGDNASFAAMHSARSVVLTNRSHHGGGASKQRKEATDTSTMLHLPRSTNSFDDRTMIYGARQQKLQMQVEHERRQQQAVLDGRRARSRQHADAVRQQHEDRQMQRLAHSIDRVNLWKHKSQTPEATPQPRPSSAADILLASPSPFQNTQIDFSMTQLSLSRTASDSNQSPLVSPRLQGAQAHGRHEEDVKVAKKRWLRGPHGRLVDPTSRTAVRVFDHVARRGVEEQRKRQQVEASVEKRSAKFAARLFESTA